MADRGIDFKNVCRFCGLENSTGKMMFGFEATETNLLLKIKNSFPDEDGLLNSESVLPKYICMSCETTIILWDSFKNSVKLVQQSLMDKFLERAAEIVSVKQESMYHICPPNIETNVRLEEPGVLFCSSCNVQLHLNEISNTEVTRCVCSSCRFEGKVRSFISNLSRVNCPQCYRTQKNELSLQKNSLKEYKCNLCSKSYVSRSHLNRHQRTHSGPKPFVCPECGSGFWQKSSLNTHLLIHKKLSPFCCKWCGQSFRHKQTLCNHMISIHGINSSSSNLYECDKCFKKFVHKDKLLRHLRSHSGEKPFKCDICYKTFSQQVNLKTHFKKHESDNVFTEVNQSTSNVSESSQSNLIHEFLNFDNIGAEPHSLPNFPMVNSQYPEESAVLKDQSTTDRTNLSPWRFMV